MKRNFYRIFSLLTCAVFALTSFAETRSPYNVDFDTKIDVNDHEFKVASNWKHVVGSSTDWYGDTSYLSYSWKQTDGVDGSGALYLGKQEVSSGWGSGTEVYDLLVTPVVSGKISIKAKAKEYYTNSAYIEFWSLNENGTAKKELLYKFSGSDVVSDKEFRPYEYVLESSQRVGIRFQYMTIDDFYADSAEIEPERGLSVVSAKGLSSYSSGSVYYLTRSDGLVEIKVEDIVVCNTGETTLVSGEEGYNLTVCIDNASKEPFSNSVEIQQTLSPGESSEPFEAVFLVDPVEKNWTYQKSLILCDGINQTSLKFPYAYVVAYEPKFIFRAKGNNSSSSLRDSQSFGLHYSDQASSVAAKSYEIYNDGAAPLEIKSISIDGGFSVTPDAAVTVGGREKTYVDVSMPASIGSHSATLTIVYVDKNGTEQTYDLLFSANVIKAGTFHALFDNTSSTPQWPIGSVAESAVKTDYTYVSSAESPYDIYLTSESWSSAATENNKFITPLLHAEAGGSTLSFDVRRNLENTNTLNVYVSDNRENWGEPVLSLSGSDLSTSFEKKTITVPEGNWYVAFAIYNTVVDNIIGLTRVEVPHDIYVTETKVKESVQSGVNENFGIKFIALSNEQKEDYSLKFVVERETGEHQEYAYESKNLEAHAKNSVEFTAKWAPVVEATTTFDAYFLFTFTDGNTIRVNVSPIVVTNAPDFLFLNKGQSANNRPDNVNLPADFGKSNQSGSFKEYDIVNFGTAPLTVKSLSVPDGFSVEPAGEFVVDGREADDIKRQTVKVSVSATEPGEYNGNLEVVYVDADGVDQTYTLPVTVVFVDPSEWFANFDDGTSYGAWPAGSVVSDGIQLYNNNYNNPDCAATAYSSNQYFVTPKLEVADGDMLIFDAKSTSPYNSGSIVVYASSDREVLIDAQKRSELTPVASFTNGDSEPETAKLTTNFSRFETTVAEAGDYYFCFVISNAAIDNLYGLPLADIKSDLMIKQAIIPAEGMQNVLCSVKLDVLNFGTSEISPEDYTVNIYVDGQLAATQEGSVEIPVSNKLTSLPATIFGQYRTPLIGEHEVYVQLTVNGDIYNTESVTVNFAKEVANGEVIVGTFKEINNNQPIASNYNNSESLSLYTPAEIGLAGGEKISSIRIRGYYEKGGNKYKDLQIFYAWVDDTQLALPDNVAYDVTGMTELRSGEFEIPMAGSASEYADMIVLTPSEPIIYPEGKSLLFFIKMYNSPYLSSKPFFEVTETNPNSAFRMIDGDVTKINSKPWNSNERATVLHLDLIVDPVTFGGSVVNAAGEGVADAVVTLVSQDGDNVQYSTVSRADGSFDVDVIQAERVYTVSAASGLLYGEVADVNPSDGSPVEIVLAEMVNISRSYIPVDADNVTVKINLGIPAGLNGVVLPVDLSVDEIAEVFGENAKVYNYYAVEKGVAKFYLVSEVKAGEPFILVSDEESAITVLNNKRLVSAITKKGNGNVIFNGTYTSLVKNENQYVPAEDMADANSGVVVNIPAYSAYLESGDAITSIETLDKITGIEEILTIDLENAEIYDLNGFRVVNPAPGIYIVNGKKTVIK